MVSQYCKNQQSSLYEYDDAPSTVIVVTLLEGW